MTPHPCNQIKISLEKGKVTLTWRKYQLHSGYAHQHVVNLNENDHYKGSDQWNKENHRTLYLTVKSLRYNHLCRLNLFLAVPPVLLTHFLRSIYFSQKLFFIELIISKSKLYVAFCLRVKCSLTIVSNVDML